MYPGWTKTGTRSSTPYQAGRYQALYCTPPYYWTFAISGVSGRSYYAKAYVTYNTYAGYDTWGGGMTLMQFRAGSTVLVSVRVTSGGQLQLWNDVGSSQIGSSATAWWNAADYHLVSHYVELKCNIGSGSVDSAELRIDGVSVASGSGLSISDSTISAFDVGLISVAGSEPWDWTFEHMAVNDDQGTNDNSWPGLTVIHNMARAWSSITAAGWKDGLNSGDVFTYESYGTFGGRSSAHTVQSQARNSVSQASNYIQCTSMTYKSLTHVFLNYNSYVGGYETIKCDGYRAWVRSMQYIAFGHAEEAATGTKAGLLGPVTNPTGMTGLSFNFGNDAGAYSADYTGGTGGNWANSKSAIQYAPVGTNRNLDYTAGMVWRLEKVTATTAVVSICGALILVEWEYPLDTTLYLHSASNNWPVARHENNTSLLDGSRYGWYPYRLSGERQGVSPVQNEESFAIAGPVNGVEMTSTSGIIEWLSPPLARDVTISGTITINFWTGTSNSAGNQAWNVYIDRVGPDGIVISRIAQSARTTHVTWNPGELENFTLSPTSTDMKRGDRIRVVPYTDDAATGNMVDGFSAYISHGVEVPGAIGDSWVRFTELIVFEEPVTPAGTTLYLIQTAGPDTGSADERLMKTTRGSGVQSTVTNTQAGLLTTPAQLTASAGGSVIEWYSDRLEAFTLSGDVTVNLWMSESASGANVSPNVEIAVCDTDGSNAVVFGAAGRFAEVPTSSTAITWIIAGKTINVAQMQRIRVRVRMADPVYAMASGFTVSLYFASTSGAVSGDSFIRLSESASVYSFPTVAVAPTADIDATGWSTAPMWSKIDEDEGSPDGVVITATAS